MQDKSDKIRFVYACLDCNFTNREYFSCLFVVVFMTHIYTDCIRLSFIACAVLRQSDDLINVWDGK